MSKTPPLFNGNKKSFLKNLEACSGVSLGKTPFLIRTKKNVCNKCRHALEFVKVRFIGLLIKIRKSACKICSHALEFGWEDFLLSNGNEERRLQDLKSYTKILLKQEK